jgi:copper chaperone CopZ
MTCNHCVANVQNALEAVHGVIDIKINLAKKTAIIDGDFDEAEIGNAIEKAGYKLL